MLRLFVLSLHAFVLSLYACLASATAPLQFQPYALETQAHGTHAAEIAWLDVPARYANANSARLRLRIVRLLAPITASRAARSDAPIVYLAGGPGGSGVGSARGPRWPMFDRMRQHGDVLLLDQRGAGESSLPPECPHQAMSALGHAAKLAIQRQVAAQCVAFWRAQNIDLDAFNTEENAHDVNALRLALQVPKLRLWAISYGTHLATAVLRHHGEHIERVILMGYEGPDDTLKLPLAADALLSQIEAQATTDPRVIQEFKPVVANLHALLAKLAQTPQRARSLMTGKQVTIGPFEAQLGVVLMLTKSDTMRHVPLAIGLALQGDAGLLSEYVQGYEQALTSFRAMPLAMDIASGVSAARSTQIAVQTPKSVLGGALNFPFPDIGTELGITDLGAVFRTPLITAVPTLFVTGSMDGRTPSANMEAALPGFSMASQLRIDGAGHDNDLWLSHPEIADTLEAFMQGTWEGEKQLQAPRLAFATSMTSEAWGLLKQSIGIGGIALILAGIAALPLGLFWWWRRRKARKLAKR